MSTLNASPGKRPAYPSTEEKVARNEALRKDHEEGMGLQRLGRKYRISPARVRQIIDAGVRRS
jgi:Mor family transcriptional regulator